MWIGMGVGLTTIVASTEQLIGSLSAGAQLLRPFTILRSRLLISYESDQLAASERSFGTYGEIVVTDRAVSVGTTAIPDPSATDGNPEADWFLFQTCYSSFRFATSAAFNSGDGASHQYVVDSKAMRKVGPDDDIVSKFSEVGGFGAVLGTFGRRLIQLH